MYVHVSSVYLHARVTFCLPSPIGLSKTTVRFVVYVTKTNDNRRCRFVSVFSRCGVSNNNGSFSRAPRSFASVSFDDPFTSGTVS